MAGVDLSAIRVLHRERRRTPFDKPEPAPGVLAVNTCQRQLQIAAAPLVPPGGWAYRQGFDAYLLLLEIACGLKSAVPGETHVLGQIKTAWKAVPADQPAARALRPTMQALFADAKRIRASFLQGIGRQSYGRLAHALVKPAGGDHILIVGGGQMAREMGESFRSYPRAVWARGAPRGFSGQYASYRPGAEQAALDWADHVVFCTPPAAGLERSWAAAARGRQLKTLLHLGYHSVPKPWAEQTNFRTLHDLLKLKRARSNVTSLRLQRARRACRSAAQARLKGQTGQPDVVALG